jgi:alpha-glucosidase
MTLIPICSTSGGEYSVTAPNGRLKVIVADAGGIHYRVEVGGKTVVTDSPLGLEFEDGTKLGPTAVIRKSATGKHDGKWENHFGNRRFVRDNWRELRLTLEERGTPVRTFGLIVRAYDDGVAFRYDLPASTSIRKRS